MKTFFLRFFTWWNGATFGTLLWTALYGELVGEDEFGNRYYRTKGGKIDPSLGFERRWVIYSGIAEASTVGVTAGRLGKPGTKSERVRMRGEVEEVRLNIHHEFTRGGVSDCGFGRGLLRDR